MLSVVIPTYNERGNLEPLITRLAGALGPGSEIVIVDDNSQDGTAAAAEALAEKFPVRLVKRQGKLGLASAVVSGVAAAKGDVIVVMDADLSHPPEKAPELAAALADCDLAIGSRLMAGGKVETWPLHRKMISWGAESLARIVLGVKVSDPLSGFFAVRKEFFLKTRFRAKGYKLLLNVLADNPGIRIREIPYVFSDRHAGETKLGAGEIINYLLDLFRIALR
jgi:dolichol-phosphate mannosyltransferase